METSEPSTSTTTSAIDNSTETVEKNPNETNTNVDEFLSTGRTGRRNALPDILEQKSSQLNTSDLPNQLEKLNFNDSTQHNGSSGETSGTASTSNQNK